MEEIPRFGFTLSEVTRDLHANGPVGVMTDYEAKFYELGQPINRLVATMVPWEEPFPANIKTRWLDTFAAGVPEEKLGAHVLAEGNYLWHIFSWELVPCLTGGAARQALAEVPEETLYFFYCEYPPASQPLIQALPKSKALALADRPADDYPSFNGSDWYLVDKDFSWTYVHTHEEICGPYFCRAADGR